MPFKFNELLQQVVDESAVDIAKELALAGDVSLKASLLVMHCLQRIAGGEVVYAGTGRLWHLDERDRKIYKKFTGHNHFELSREFGVTVRRIYDILKKQV